MSVVAFTSVNAQKIFTLQIEHKVGNALLVLNDSVYTNTSNENFSVRSFRYYISGICLIDDAHQQKDSFPGKYFLVDERIDTSKKIQLNTKLKTVTGIVFRIGVDSLRSVSGVQTGTLDPARGMFWTWNTGYINAKLEGYCNTANTPQHLFSYHVGGYKTGENVNRYQHFTWEKNANTIVIDADILKWFSGKKNISIASLAFCHAPGAEAMMLADNYANMFSLEDAY